MAITPALASPFGLDPFDEVPLPRAPLAQTLTQIRFPSQSALALGGDDVAADLARALRTTYPVFNKESQFAVTISLDGTAVPTPDEAKIWRLSSADESWQVSFTSTFLTLSTSRYTSRDDFCDRLSAAWSHFGNVVGQPAAQRIGFRYINRVDDRNVLDNLAAMVRPEIMGATFSGGSEAPIARSLTENHYVLQDEGLLARWGILPPGDTFDPFALPPHALTSWVLDLDAFRTFAGPAGIGADVPEIVKGLSLRAYRYFRWAVTREFLAQFGGDV